MEAALLGAGHHLRALHTAREAFVLGPGFRPEVLVSEVYLPDAEGYAWWKKLRTHPALAAARFIAVTSTYNRDTVRLARESGFEYVLGRPVDLLSLDEYLVGVSPRWGRHLPGPHPWPSLSIPVFGSTGMLSTNLTATEMLAAFLCAMREREASASGGGSHLLGPQAVPPELLLRQLDMVKEALEAARKGDPARGHQLLRGELLAAQAGPRESWTAALCERYELALTTYCALFD
jgi:CheY-like chemotaxis protein